MRLVPISLREATPVQRLRTVAEFGKVRAVWAGYASLKIHAAALLCEQGKTAEACAWLSRLVATVEWMLRDPTLAGPHGRQLRAEAEAYVLALEAIDGVELGKGGA